MPRRHSPQHRPESEEARRNRVHAETRKENQQLRRALARAEKNLKKIQESQGPTEEEIGPTPAPRRDVACPLCGGETTVVQLPTGALRACRSCHWRKKEDGRSHPAPREP